MGCDLFSRAKHSKCPALAATYAMAMSPSNLCSLLSEASCLSGAYKICSDLRSLLPGAKRKKWPRSPVRSGGSRKALGVVEMNGVWVEYDPDSDPYDPRTAPLLPPRPPTRNQAVFNMRFDTPKEAVVAKHKRAPSTPSTHTGETTSRSMSDKDTREASACEDTLSIASVSATLDAKLPRAVETAAEQPTSQAIPCRTLLTMPTQTWLVFPSLKCE
eukprot:s1838_g5.t2